MQLFLSELSVTECSYTERKPGSKQDVTATTTVTDAPTPHGQQGHSPQ